MPSRSEMNKKNRNSLQHPSFLSETAFKALFKYTWFTEKSSTAGALLCITCVQKGSPPHCDYLLQVSRPLFSTHTKDHAHLADVVAQFAYPIYAHPHCGFCYKCDPYWVEWTCSVCNDFGVYQDVFREMPSIEEICGWEPTKVVIGRGELGSAEIELWRRQMRRVWEVSRRGRFAPSICQRNDLELSYRFWYEGWETRVALDGSVSWNAVTD